MTQDRTQADRFAAGTGGGTDDEAVDPTEMKPGVTRGGATVLPSTGPASAASQAEGTTGAVGEMDFTGAPAGQSGAGGVSGANASGETRGGASSGGGARATGGTGPGTAGDDPGPQSADSTLAVLGDNEPSTITQ